MHERIVYVSRAAPGVGVAELYRIIRAAHARNGADGVSGALVFLDGWFAQILEGPGEAVAACFDRVRGDGRHRDLDLRLRERAFARLFPGQAMALRTRACLEPGPKAGLLDAFGYRPGFPVDALPADALVELLVRACRSIGGVGGRRTGAPPGALDKVRASF